MYVCMYVCVYIIYMYIYIYVAETFRVYLAIPFLLKCSCLQELLDLLVSLHLL